MKLHNPPKKNTQTYTLQKSVKAFQLVTSALEQTLRTNKVISQDELDTILSNTEEILEVLDAVTRRTANASVLSGVLSENTDLMKDTELTAKWSGQQNDLMYISSLASTMLYRLFTLRHIKESDYQSLKRYWQSLSVQHQKLLTRWERATTE
jgi:NTP pyrophosphatase (non-canonical NTP hydrolase)